MVGADRCIRPLTNKFTFFLLLFYIRNLYALSHSRHSLQCIGIGAV